MSSCSEKSDQWASLLILSNVTNIQYEWIINIIFYSIYGYDLCKWGAIHFPVDDHCGWQTQTGHAKKRSMHILMTATSTKLPADFDARNFALTIFDYFKAVIRATIWNFPFLWLPCGTWATNSLMESGFKAEAFAHKVDNHKHKGRDPDGICPSILECFIELLHTLRMHLSSSSRSSHSCRCEWVAGTKHDQQEGNRTLPGGNQPNDRSKC